MTHETGWLSGVCMAFLVQLLATPALAQEAARETSTRSQDPDADYVRYEALKKERERIDLGVPIALLAAGGGVGFVTALLAVGFTTSQQCGGGGYMYPCVSFHDASPAATAVAIGGFSVAAVGGILLGVRLEQRHRIAEELRRMERGETEESAQAAPAATLDLAVDPGTGRVLLLGVF